MIELEFILSELQTQRAERLILAQQLDPSLVAVQSHRLFFRGSREDLRKTVWPALMDVYADLGCVPKPYGYRLLGGEDPRPYWNETLMDYLWTRASWQEYSREATQCMIPSRFVSRYDILRGLTEGVTISKMQIRYGVDLVKEVTDFQARFA